MGTVYTAVMDGFNLIDVASTPCTPIASPTVVNGDLFLRQGKNQLNGGRRGTGDV